MQGDQYTANFSFLGTNILQKLEWNHEEVYIISNRWRMPKSLNQMLQAILIKFRPFINLESYKTLRPSESICDQFLSLKANKFLKSNVFTAHIMSTD